MSPRPVPGQFISHKNSLGAPNGCPLAWSTTQWKAYTVARPWRHRINIQVQLTSTTTARERS